MRSLRVCLIEELTWNYWMRRPRNNNVGDISDEIEQRRKEVFIDTAKEFEAHADELGHAIEVAEDIKGMDDEMKRFGCDAYEIVADPTEFDQAVERDDVEAARRELLMGLEKWKKDSVSSSEKGNYDTSTLTGHISGHPATIGAPTLKRSMGY